MNSIPAIPLTNSSSLKCLCHSSLVRSVSSWALQCSWCPKSWKMWLMSQVMEEQAVYLPVCQAEQLLFFSSFLHSVITVHYITNSFDHFKSILIDFKWKKLYPQLLHWCHVHVIVLLLMGVCFCFAVFSYFQNFVLRLQEWPLVWNICIVIISSSRASYSYLISIGVGVIQNSPPHIWQTVIKK